MDFSAPSTSMNFGVLPWIRRYYVSTAVRRA